MLPWMGSSGGELDQAQLGTALQGLLVHGPGSTSTTKGRARFVVYRHFENYSKHAAKNLAVHAWLSELQREKDERGSLPPVLYHQIDGGKENANSLTIAVAEWLVLKGLCRKVVITRLPVGHTHEVTICSSLDSSAPASFIYPLSFLLRHYIPGH